MSTAFKPAWWLKNPHLQTLWPVMLRQRTFKQLDIERERIELPDGDFIDIDWVGREKTGPLVVILHGLEGSIHSHYAKSMMNCMQQQGWRSVFMHFRGCSGVPNRLPRGYHSGETSDVHHVVSMLREREPDTMLLAIGYSLGGNILLKWLGETGDQNPLTAAVSVSVPFELHKTCLQVQQGIGRFYQWYFLRTLRNRLSYKFNYVPTPVDPDVFFSLRTLKEFDDHYTAPLHGFKDAMHYYSVTSSRQYLSKIAVPTLILHAKDDPLMPPDVIPTQHELASCVRLELSEKGGHVGFVSGKYPWRPQYWLEERIPLFLQQYA